MSKAFAVISFLLLASLDTMAQLPTGVKFKPMLPVQAVGSGERKIWMGEIPGRPKHFYVLDMRGLIYHIMPAANDSWAKKTILDIRDKVRYAYAPEYGAWSIAYHPRFVQNRKFYLLYIEGTDVADGYITADGPVHVEEWEARGVLRDSLSKLRTVFTYPHTKAFGVSTFAFGADGYMYISTNDYATNSQDLTILGRKVLRIDVDSKDAGKEYAVPKDNPFYNHADPNVKKEIWAYGFRNLWNLYSDHVTGDLWGVDVGQSDHEEINLIQKGKNYGWGYGGDGVDGQDGSTWTGFNGPCATSREKANCDKYTDPVYAFKWGNWNNLGFRCISGGLTYRGNPQSPFYGSVFMADVNRDHLVAMAKGKEPQLIGNPGEVAPGLDDHEGLVWMTHDSYWNVYAVFLGRRDFNIYTLDHPALAPLETPMGIRRLAAPRSRLRINLGTGNVPAGPAYALDGKRIINPRGTFGLAVTAPFRNPMDQKDGIAWEQKK